MAARRTENFQAQTASKMDNLDTENDVISEDEDDDKGEDEDGYDECDGYSISNFYKEQNNETKWIKTHIKKKCKEHQYLHPLYAGKLSFSHFGSHRLRSRNPECNCGKRRSEHDSTDAFGEIQFNNDSNQLAKFIRVDDDTLLPELLDHYIYKWKTPHALISVVGGDMNLRMTKQSSEMFYSGLTKIGEATWNGEGILFITGGTNMTVTKYIGEAFKTKHLLSGTDWTRSATPIIGVVPWNTIQRTDQLICTDGKWPIKYGQILGQSITGDGEEIHDKYKEMLDSNHTNFLFVDGNGDDDNAATTDFRFKLEKIIRESLDGKFILMVIQGGLDTIKFINEAIQNKEDILLIKGYGGIADIISSALNLTQMDNKKRKELVQSAIEQDDYLLRYALTEEESIRTAEQIEIILQNKELLTVFDLGCCDQAEDFGIILENIIHERIDTLLHKFKKQTLFQQWSERDFSGHCFRNMFNSSLIRSDLLMGKGGGKTTKTKQETGEEKMKQAIRSGDIKLVSELLQSGKYTEFYQDFIREIFLRDKYECLNVFFENGINTRQLLDFEIWQRYFLENKAVVPKIDNNDEIPIFEKLSDFGYGSPFPPSIKCRMDFSKVKADEVTVGLEQMFVLSVLFKKHEMSKMIWSELDEPVFAALAVKRLHQIVIDLAEIKDSEILKTFEQISNEFTDLAVGVIDACYENKSFNYILRRQLKYWKDGSVLSIASEVENKVFISRPACQELLDSIWWGNDKLENNTPRTRTISIKRPLSYIVFLGLYSYHMLVNFKPQFNVIGGILCFWVFTLVCEEIRQLSIIKSNSTESMLGKYIGQSLNVLDILTVSVFIIGIILRFVPNASCFEAARMVFCINLILCFVRILRMFVPNEQLGPKLVMINRMIWRDLLPFLAIFVVFIVAYAIASEAILYPNTELTWKLVYQLPRKAYWQIYGELFLENIEGDVDCTNDPALYEDYNQLRCPSEVGKYMAAILLGIYVLFTNVLLLNLLIAMFSYTFSSIQDQSHLYWCLNYLNLVQEYYARPVLPPPLIICEHLYRLYKYCRARCDNLNKVDDGFNPESYNSCSNFDVNLDYKTHLYYDNVERREAKACLQKRQEESSDNSKHVFQRFQSDIEAFINTPKSEKPLLNKDDFRTEIKKLRQSFKKEMHKVHKKITKTVDDKINEALAELINSPRKT